MRGLGTILNVVLMLVGGFAGMLFGRYITERIRQTLISAMGVAVIILGAGGALSEMLVIEDGALKTQGTMMMVISLAIGSLIGEIINLDGLINRLGDWLKVKSRSSGDSRFTDAFVSASCTVCIGAMAIVGSIEDGIYGNYSILLTKGILDGVIICLMTASLGRGSIFSTIPVALLQGSITCFASLLGGFIPSVSLSALSYVGSVLIFCVGLNLIREQKIRVANMLPSLIFATLWPIFF